MKRKYLIVAGVILIPILMVLAAIYAPNTLPTNTDFGAVYNASVAFVHRVPIYDVPAVTAVAAENAGVPVDKFFLAPFPYPPWYALSTFYLGWFPIQSAALLWFEINLAMLFFSIWFLTAGWPGRMRLIAFPLGLFFMPVIGALSIGQNVFPVLLGGAMLMYALKREHIILTTIGTVLITYKPHIGALMVLSVLVYLFASRSRPALSSTEGFGRDTLRSLPFTGLGLSIVSFIADPAWYIRYPQMLLGITSANYGTGQSAELCTKCTSLPVLLSRHFFDGALLTAALIAGVTLLVFIVLFLLVRGSLLKQPTLLLNAALLVTLLVSPYLFNYDFIFLLIPYAVLSERGSLWERIAVIILYLLPSIAILIYGRAGNITLLFVAFILIWMVFARAKSQVDVPAPASYNVDN